MHQVESRRVVLGPAGDGSRQAESSRRGKAATGYRPRNTTTSTTFPRFGTSPTQCKRGLRLGPGRRVGRRREQAGGIFSQRQGCNGVPTAQHDDLNDLSTLWHEPNTM